MLRNTDDLRGYAIAATDGHIGHVKDFYFDDHAWVIRYLVVDTASWLPGRKVLISPISVGNPNWADRTLPANITREQVKGSPDIDTRKPVTRQHENELLGWYGYPLYWGGTGLWGYGLYPNAVLPGYAGFGSGAAPRSQTDHAYAEVQAAKHRDQDPHLRSCEAVTGYHMQASDGEIGHVKAFLVEEGTWAIRYLVVDTSNWWFGHEVLISPRWIQGVSWAERKVSVDMTRQAVKDAPAYDPRAPLDRQGEIEIHRHYGRTGYWSDATPNALPTQGENP